MDNGPAIRQRLADVVMTLARMDIVDFNGHASVRCEDGSFLINSGDSTRSAMTPADISTLAADGTLLAGPRPPLEMHLHRELYAARADAGAIIHAHPKWSTLLTSAGVVVQPVFAQGCLVAGLPVFDDAGSIKTAERGAALARVVGEAPGALLKAHGSVLIGADLIEAFVLAVYLEQNCERQYRALQVGSPYVFSDDEVAACRRGLAKRGLFEKCWNFYQAR